MLRPRIFVSYSHRDAEYLAGDSLIGFLRGLEEEEDVQFWTDERLETGMSWDEEIGRGEMQMYRVVRDTGYDSRIQATMGVLTPLISREQEMNLMMDRWASACQGTGQIILLRADSGIGKSRLVAEMKTVTSGCPMDWIEWHGSSRQQDTPFHPVMAWLETWIGLESGTADEKLARIEGHVAALGGAPDDAAAAIAALLSIPAPKHTVAAQNAREQKEHILDTVVQLVIDASLHKPLILIVEDLQWIDASTVELLERLIEHVPAAPILVLLTSRLETVPPAWTTREYVSRLTLDRLDRAAALQMVLAITDDVCSACPIDEGVRDIEHARALLATRSGVIA